ncbi:DUF6629 family protein [Streptomyces spororaveus]|uniref:DUF6629 family protein n=1 Tax=Streptomyces spororaveus TaxID=284039 RepID=UPI003687DA0F
MCWSATADLVAGTVISAAGIVCLARLRRARDLPVAALPLLAVWVPAGVLLAAAPGVRRRLWGRWPRGRPPPECSRTASRPGR